MTKRHTVLGALLLSALLVGACATGEGATDGSAVSTAAIVATSTTTKPPTTTTTLLPTTTTTAPTTTTTVPEIEVVATDYRFDGLPATVPVGTKLSLVNESSVEFHEMAVLQLHDSETRPLEELSRLPFEELHYRSTEIGTLRTVIFAMPDSPQYEYRVGPPAFGGPGRYLVFCSILVGSDPESVRNWVDRGPQYSVEGVQRHYEVGMMTEVIVER